MSSQSSHLDLELLWKRRSASEDSPFSSDSAFSKNLKVDPIAYTFGCFFFSVSILVTLFTLFIFPAMLLSSSARKWCLMQFLMLLYSSLLSNIIQNLVVPRHHFLAGPKPWHHFPHALPWRYSHCPTSGFEVSDTNCQEIKPSYFHSIAIPFLFQLLQGHCLKNGERILDICWVISCIQIN